MAIGRIKGITIELGGDTTKLQTALKGVTSEIKNTQAQLKDVEKLLKLDPGNTELLAQRQRLLGDAVNATKDKLETLKTAAEQANAALASGDISRDQYDALQREIVETTQELQKLEAQARESGEAVESIANKGEKLQAMGDNIAGVGQKLLPVTAAVTGLGTMAVKTASDFDAGMSKVASISGAAGEELDALRDKAREMGSKTKFSASEAAEAMNYMAMAGWKTEEMLGGIEGIMNLAAASGESLAMTSDIVTDALTTFGLSAQDSAHFADVLAAASSNANTNVSMMGETFKYAAPIAGALGFSVEDTAEAIGLMANAGIKSSQAGTSLRSIMNALSGEVKLSGEALGDVTIQTSNADGSMRELGDILADCRVAFSQLSESEQAAAAESLVGKNAMSGFLALMNAAPEDIDKLSIAIANCDGVSQSMSGTMQDNLQGQLTILKSQLEELAISFGELIMPTLQKVTGLVQAVVDKLNHMDEGTKKLIITIALVVAALGPALIAVGKVMSAVGTIMTMGPKIIAGIKAAQGAFAAFNAVLLANPILLVVAAVAALVAAFVYFWNTSEAFRQFWIDLWESIKATAIAVWTAISTFFSDAWTALKDTAVSIFTPVRDFFVSVWTAVKETVIGAWTAIYDTVAPLLQAYWYLVETIFLACQILINRAMEAISSVISGAWQAITAFLSPILEGLRDFFQTIWTAITTVVSTAWENMKSAISTRLNAIFTAVSTVWGQVSGAVSTYISGIVSTITAGFNNAVEFIRSLISQAYRWGRDLIMGIIDGIKGAIGELAGAVTGVADLIRSYLHFSVPDIGPLTDYEQWMPDFMGGLARGIEQSRGMIRSAMENVSGDMMLTTSVNGTAAMTEAPGRAADQTNAVVAILAQYLPYLPRLAEMRVVTDTGALVGQLAPQMDRQLGLLSDRQRRL